MSIDQPDLCVRAAIALVDALDRKAQAGGKVPRVIAVTSMGLGEQHDILPMVMRVSPPAFAPATTIGPSSTVTRPHARHSNFPRQAQPS